MHSINDVVGKPIISAESGDKLGSVSDALLDAGQVRIVGLVVSGGLLAGERVVPFGNVQTLGGDTVIVRSTELIDAKQWREGGSATIRSSSVLGKPVVTASGRRIGTVSDLFVDEKTGTLLNLEAGASDLAGLRTKRSQLRVSPDLRIGPDAVVVPESAAGDAHGPAVDEELRREDDANRPA